MALPSQVEARWTIGTFLGVSPFDVADVPDAPTLTAKSVTDISADFVADPFLLRHDARILLFFEVWNTAALRGELGLASSLNGLSWQYEGIVLAEPFHLSYPHVFSHRGEFWMTPECAQAGSQILYRAVEFPMRWEPAGTIWPEPLRDPTLVERDDGWWMFAGVGPGGRSELHAFHAAELAGPWHAHPCGPISVDGSILGRPAGRVRDQNGQLTLLTQLRGDVYGSGVVASNIVRLDRDVVMLEPTHPTPLLSATGTGWRAMGMHHLDALQLADGNWLIAVDGNGHPGA